MLLRLVGYQAQIPVKLAAQMGIITVSSCLGKTFFVCISKHLLVAKALLIYRGNQASAGILLNNI